MASSLLTGTIPVTTTATLMFKSVTPSGNTLTITTHQNSSDIYIGGSTVNTTDKNGIVLAKSLTTQIFVPYGVSVYAAGAGAGDTVKWLTFDN